VTSVLERAREILRNEPAIGDRVTGLDTAVAASRGRLVGPEHEAADLVVQRAGRRLRLSADHTVVALGGATGSGKSSTFNALTGLDVAAVGVRRPTTSWATACIWGTRGADPLLDWLEIPPRHRVSRDSMLAGIDDAEADLQGLVLLDLPDHDSTEVTHHLEVERLVALSDMLVWVLDPQKYADAAIHDRYLRPLAEHSDVMLIVLNHIDEVPAARRDAMIADCRRLLDLDGLTEVPLVVTSARTGEGVDELRRRIGERVAAKDARNARLLSDVLAAADALGEVSGPAPREGFTPPRVERLVAASVDAAGVPSLVEATTEDLRGRYRRATAWPPYAWIRRGEGSRSSSSRTEEERVTALHRARIDAAVRDAVDEVTDGLAPAWTAAVRAASVDTLPEMEDALDRAVAATDLGADRVGVWARALQLLQYVALLAALGGLGWGVAGAVSAAVPTPPDVLGVPASWALLGGGLASGLVLWVVGWAVVAGAVRGAATDARARLEDAVGGVVRRLVVVPVEGELDACRATRAGLDAAGR